MSNWQFPQGPGNAGTPVVGGGGSLAPSFRDPLDARRAAVGQIPSAQYPDGYLGNVQSRRQDRLLDSLKTRQNQRAYTRGVHKGEKVDPADYLWPREFGPMTGIARQMRTGLRAAPLMTMQESLLAGGRLQNPRGSGALLMDRPVNPQEPSDLKRLSPSWK